MILMWSCLGNMPKYYPGLRDILPDPSIIGHRGNSTNTVVKSKWAMKGEKSPRYFCSLESRNCKK